tara:strand:+ start:3431 stop:3652 length:222 start_codon:yes stop_codon:yes gene_type:complete
MAITRDSAKILNLDVKPSVTVENIAVKTNTRQSKPNWLVNMKLGIFLFISVFMIFFAGQTERGKVFPSPLILA